MENVQQSVTSLGPNARARLSVQPHLGRRSDGNVSAHRDRISPIEFLAARYPVIRRLAGELSFRVVARRFILSEPPSGRIPLSYGDNFPRFLRSQGNAASIKYVADVAELEMVRGRAQRAAAVRPLGTEALSSLRTKSLNGLRISLHPSVCLVQSRFPIVTIWENNQSDEESGMIDRWCAEAALVARPFLKVEIRRLPPGGYAFVRALSEGQSVAAAARIAAAAAPKFAFPSNLALLMHANVVVGIREAI